MVSLLNQRRQSHAGGRKKKSSTKRGLLRCGVALVVGVCCMANTVVNQPMLQSFLPGQAYPDWEALGENSAAGWVDRLLTGVGTRRRVNSHQKNEGGRGEVQKETLAPATAPPTPPVTEQDLELPTWFVEYAKWHKQQLEILHSMKDPQQRFNTPGIKYLILRCPKWQEQCGGTADRLQSLPLMLRYGAALKRLVFYNWVRPHALEEFLVPTPLGINWTFPDWFDQELERTDNPDRQAQLDSMVLIKNPQGVELVRNEFNQTILYLNSKQGADTIYNSLREENLERNPQQQEKDDPPLSEAYHSLWHANLQPSPPVQALIHQHMQDLQLTPNEYTSFHFRSMYLTDERNSADTIINASNCALHMATQNNNPTIFVATDSKAATNTAVRYIRKIQGTRAVTREHGQEPLHLDRGHHFLGIKKERVATNPSDYYDTFVDLYLMQMAKCIVYGRGGFGIWANLMTKDSTCMHNYFYHRQYHFSKDRCPAPPLPELEGATLPEESPKAIGPPKGNVVGYKGEVYCQFDPKDRTKCKSILVDHVCSAGNATSQSNTSNQHLGSRVLVLGDATFGFNFLSMHVQHRLKFATKLKICGRGNKRNLDCQWKDAQRCKNREFYGFSDHVLNARNESEPLPQWLVTPRFGMEGPAENGLSKKGCSDCAGCKSGLLFCSAMDDNDACQEDAQPSNYHGYQGGYINVEFARDVVLQTEHYNTTQENIALFLKRQYNAPELVEVFGKPFCFVNTGHRDALVKGITQENYIENVRWYLQLLQPQCQCIIWVSTIAPRSDDNSPRAQTRLEWNDAVRYMLSTNSFGGHRIPFLDVYPASVSYEHKNNVHMAPQWYRALGDFLGDIVESCASFQLGTKETGDSSSQVLSTTASTKSGLGSIQQKSQVQVGQLSPQADSKKEAHCQWRPANRTQCREMLLPHLCPPGKEHRNAAPENGKGRVLVFGDSLSGFNFLSGYLQHRLKYATKLNVCSPRDSDSADKIDLQCNWKNAERCSNRQFFGFQDTIEGSDSPAPQWVVHPEAGREGPADYGLGHHGCTDCAGCKSGFLSCSRVLNQNEGGGSNGCQEDAQPSNYHGYQGGYISVEFARDVVLQTEHYNTTQENIALFLKQDYNSPELVKAFGKPFCFVNTGHHDVLIQGITQDTYIENVRWYLELLQPQCEHVVWVSTTAPLSNDRIQKIQDTLEWSEAVRRMLATTSFGGGHKIPFLDVYHASMNFTHRDNIHMTLDWYRALGDFLGDLVEGCASS